MCKPDSVFIENKEKKPVEWWVNGKYFGWAIGLKHYYTKTTNQVIIKYYYDYDTTYVFIKSKPEVFLKQEGFLCPWSVNKGFVSFSTADSLSSFFWQLSNEKVFEPKPKLTKPGLVSFVYCSPKQCEWQQELETKDTCPEIRNCFLPNSFSPNNDGLNDTYKIECENLIEFEIRIFNRWGEQIFYTKNPNEEWDGTFKDTKCPLGLYLTTIKVTYPLGMELYKTEIKKISLNLIR
ncbi:MAG: gliding motility-associated C-terminal domain-containing protein [Bacteroidetes bacterium]|nr:gliding motility-associated C-terminal domain-containing protein [Bacteroidota bacterium]